MKVGKGKLQTLKNKKKQEQLNSTLQQVLTPIMGGLMGADINAVQLVAGDSETYSIVFAIIEEMKDLSKCILNEKEVDILLKKIVNIPVPDLWKDYNYELAKNLIIKYDEDKVSNTAKKLKKYEKEYPKEYKIAYKIYSSEIRGILQPDIDEQEVLLNQVPNDEIEKYKHSIKIDKIENVVLYHGTSYDNYLQIIQSGYIHKTNYSSDDLNFHGKTIENIYKSETGFVFTLDSMDFSLRHCFGGYRRNLVPWASEEKNVSKAFVPHNKQIGNKLDKNNLGVIFEINPQNYDVYMLYGKKEFIIAGDVSIADTIPHFYYIDENYMIRELTKEEIDERGVA